MAMEKELKCEVDMWAFDKIKIFALASFYKWKKKNKKHFVIAVKKSLLDQVTEKMLYKTRDTYIYTYIYIYIICDVTCSTNIVPKHSCLKKKNF